jgi:hypothetical protein
MSSRSAFTRPGARRVGACVAFAALMLAGSGACHRGAAAGAVLAIQTPEADRDADVWVDGHYVGSVDALGKGQLPPIRLAPGVHRVEVRKPGRFPVQRTVRVPKGVTADVVIAAELLEDPS